MPTLQTRFAVGDTVYATYVGVDAVPIQCPDCLGTMKWEAHLPTGEVESIQCPSCKFGYMQRGTIDEYRVVSDVRELTIGQVGYDNEGPRYMCKETGIGSGTVWNESRLYATREEAESAIPTLAEAQEEERRDYGLKQYILRKGDSPGCMTAYYRKEIREANKKLAAAKAGLERIRGAK